MKILDVLGGILSLFVVASLGYSGYLAHTGGFLPHNAVSKTKIFPLTLSVNPDTLSARAVVVYDPTSMRILYAKNMDDTLPLASLAKLMTAQTILTLQNKNEAVSITKNDLAPEGDWGLKPGDVWSLEQLLTFGLVASANDAMAAAAATIGTSFIDDMNRTAQDLHLSHTYFSNPTGLDVDIETAGAYGSASDVALLASAFLKTNPALFEETAKRSVSIRTGRATLTATSTGIAIQDIPGLIAAKTGYTDLAGGNLVAIFDIEIGHPVVVVVLGSTLNGRFDDVRALIGAARSDINSTPQ
jgi:D-alanyl-D-alanine carboxypeptidase